MTENDTEIIERLTALEMAGQGATADRLQRVYGIRASLNQTAPVYIIPASRNIEADEMKVQTLSCNGVPAVTCYAADLTAALAIENGDPIPPMLLIVKEGRSDFADRMKAALDNAEMQGVEVPDTIIVPTEKPLDRMAPGELTAWINLTAGDIDREGEKYQHTFGADLIDQDNEAWEGGRREPLSTGFHGIDTMLDGGLYPEALYSIGAVSSLGKTTFVLQIADYIAASGRDVLYVALEQSAAELRAKTISRMTDEIDHEFGRLTATQIINPKKRAGWICRNGTTKTAQETAYRTAIDKYKRTIGKHMRIIEGVGNITVSRIRGEVERNIRYRGQSPVVIIDYTQILAPGAEKLTDKQNVDRNIVELKRLARDKHTPVIAICSFNRNNYYAPVDKDAFKESGSIEYSADVLIGLQPFGMIPKTDDKAGAQNKATVSACIESNDRFLEVVILKNRNGSCGTVLFDYSACFNRYTDKGIKPKAPRSIIAAESKPPKGEKKK